MIKETSERRKFSGQRGQSCSKFKPFIYRENKRSQQKYTEDYKDSKE